MCIFLKEQKADRITAETKGVAHMKTMKVNDIVTAALGIALVFLATWLLKVPNGIQGYFNLGDGFLLLFASVLNPFLAFMVGGVGSALADITGGYGMYALFTLLIKGMEAVLVSWLVCRGRSSFRYVAYILGGLLMVGGYFLADAYINQSWQLSLTGIPGNLVQAAAGYVIALAAYPLLQKRMHRHPDMHHKTV